MKKSILIIALVAGGLFGSTHTAFAAESATTSVTTSVITPKPANFNEAITATLGFTQAWGVLDDLYTGILFKSLETFFQGGIIDNSAINKIDVVKSFAVNQRDISKLETATTDGRKLSQLLTELRLLTPCERITMREWGPEKKRYPDLDGCPSGFVDGLVAFVGQHVTSTTDQLNGWTAKMAQRELIPAEFDTLTFAVDIQKTKLPDLFKVLKAIQVFHGYASRDAVKKVLPSGLSDEELERIRKEAYDKGYAAGVTSSESKGDGSTLKLGKWEVFAGMGFHVDEDVGGPNGLRYENASSVNLGGRYTLLDHWLAGEAGFQIFSVTPTYLAPSWMSIPKAERLTVFTPFLGLSFFHDVVETDAFALTPRISLDVGYGFAHGVMAQATAQMDFGLNTSLGRFGVSPGFGVHHQRIDAVLGPDAFGENVKTEDPSNAFVGSLEFFFHFGGEGSLEK